LLLPLAIATLGMFASCGRHDPPNNDRISAAAKAQIQNDLFGEVVGFPDIVAVETNAVDGDNAFVVTDVEYYGAVGLIKRRVRARCTLSMSFARGTWFGAGGRCEKVSLGRAEPLMH
jgi:hypothetical protein